MCADRKEVYPGHRREGEQLPFGTRLGEVLQKKTENVGQLAGRHFFTNKNSAAG